MTDENVKTYTERVQQRLKWRWWVVGILVLVLIVVILIVGLWRRSLASGEVWSGLLPGQNFASPLLSTLLGDRAAGGPTPPGALPDCLFTYSPNCAPQISFSAANDQVTVTSTAPGADTRSWRRLILGLMWEQSPLLISYSPDSPIPFSLLDAVTAAAQKYNISPLVLSYLFWKKTEFTTPEWALFVQAPDQIATEIAGYRRIYAQPWRQYWNFTGEDRTIARRIADGHATQRAIRHYCLKHWPVFCDELWHLLTSVPGESAEQTWSVYQVNDRALVTTPLFAACFNQRAQLCGRQTEQPAPTDQAAQTARLERIHMVERIVCVPIADFFINCPLTAI